MFAYCLNNPINFVDSVGATAEALQWWLGSMWWLCGADTVLPIGDLIYTIGIIVLLYDAYNTTCNPRIPVDVNDASVDSQSSTQSVSSSTASPSAPEPPNNNKKPSLKSLTKYLIKKLGLDPHALKREYLGQRAEVKLYDLAYDTATGIVYIITKAGQIVTETYYNVFDDIFLR